MKKLKKIDEFVTIVEIIVVIGNLILACNKMWNLLQDRCKK